nr:hypothetical protein [Tanacetum cinerariifolium]
SGGSKRHKSSGSSSFNTESEEAIINLNTNVGDNNKDEVHEIRRPGGRDKARASGKNKGSKTSRSSSVNEDALARLMVTDMTGERTTRKILRDQKMNVECHDERLQLKSIEKNKKT